MFNLGKIIKKYKSSSLLLLLIVISFLSISFSTGVNNFSLKRVGTSVFSIFQLSISSSTNFIADTINSIGELQKLKEEQVYLLEMVQNYQIRDRSFLELKQENERLRKLLNFKNTTDYKFESAEIIAQDPGNIFTSFVVNKGTIHGIERNMPVLAYQNGFQGLVGKVIETGPYSSKIILIIDDISYVAARLLESRYDGLLTGLGTRNGNLIMNYVSKNAFKTITEGDLVISSGMQSLYPRGIYIGRVRSIESPEWQTSLVLEIEPIIDFTKLEFVLILTGEK